MTEEEKDSIRNTIYHIKFLKTYIKNGETRYMYTIEDPDFTHYEAYQGPFFRKDSITGKPLYFSKLNLGNNWFLHFNSSTGMPITFGSAGYYPDKGYCSECHTHVHMKLGKVDENNNCKPVCSNHFSYLLEK